MKNVIIFIAAFLTMFSAFSAEVIDIYDFKLQAMVPRTYDNMQSQGYRKYQGQLIVGQMFISYDADMQSRPMISFSELTNVTHKTDGKPITYSCIVNNDGSYAGPLTRVNLIGDNMSGKFTVPSVCFWLDAEPSYSIGEDDEDNSLLLAFSSLFCFLTMKQIDGTYFRTIGGMRGFAAGTLGCGCKAYGHVSPTRQAGWNGATDKVDDVAAVSGQWIAVWKDRSITQ